MHPHRMLDERQRDHRLQCEATSTQIDPLTEMLQHCSAIIVRPWQSMAIGRDMRGCVRDSSITFVMRTLK
jgi:hypothetical protein